MGNCCRKRERRDQSYSKSLLDSHNTVSNPILVSSASPYVPPSPGLGRASSSSGNLTDTEAILVAANYCRESSFKWQDQALIRIGSRVGKWHFIVRGVDSDTNKECNMLLTLTNIKDFPVSLNNPATCDVFANLICRISHPYIQPCEDAEYIKEKQIVVIVRKLTSKGSLKDLIYVKSPKMQYKDKYNQKGRPLDDNLIKTFGKQILEALVALNNKGIVCDCLTSANVVIDGSDARLSDLELTLLGNGMQEDIADMLAKYNVLREGKVCEIDVLLFGLVMLEMESGYGVICNQFEGEVSNNFYERGIGEGVMAILTSIFITCDATLESLLNHPYFSNAYVDVVNTKLKFLSVEKGLIKSSMQAAFQRRESMLEKYRSQISSLEEARQKAQKEMEEVFAEDKVVTRRAKPVRRASDNNITVQSSNNSSSRAAKTRRQSATSVTLKSSRSDMLSSDVDSSTTTAASATPSSEPHNSVDTTDEAAENSLVLVAEKTSSGSEIPPQYQKLLNIGLAKEQVMHKMLSDGFDPATVGW